MDPLSRKALVSLIHAALREDGAGRDLTSRAVIPAHTRIRARIVAKAPGVLAGAKLAALVFTTVDRSLRCRLHRHSGAALTRGQSILTVEGRARSIFSAERVALNILGYLSGVATLTAAYVRQARGTRAKILDTRKTVPGLRALQKDAVRAGGGVSHRSSLSQSILIKTNHLKAVRGKLTIRQAIERAKRARPKRFVEIEVTNLTQFKAALAAKPDAILLDNWSPAQIRKVVRMRRGSRPLLEASGGVTLDNVRTIARTGVDRISIGRLTHSAPSLDVSLKVIS